MMLAASYATSPCFLAPVVGYLISLPAMRAHTQVLIRFPLLPLHFVSLQLHARVWLISANAGLAVSCESEGVYVLYSQLSAD